MGARLRAAEAEIAATAKSIADFKRWGLLSFRKGWGGRGCAMSELHVHLDEVQCETGGW